MLLQLPVAEVEADIDAHHGDVENIEIERKVVVVRHELGRNAADVAKQDKEAEQDALSFC